MAVARADRQPPSTIESTSRPSTATDTAAWPASQGNRRRDHAITKGAAIADGSVHRAQAGHAQTQTSISTPAPVAARPRAPLVAAPRVSGAELSGGGKARR